MTGPAAGWLVRLGSSLSSAPGIAGIVVVGLVVGSLGAVSAGALSSGPEGPSDKLPLFACPDGQSKVGEVQPGEQVLVTARSEDGAWLQVHFPDGALGRAWAERAAFTLETDAGALPVAGCDAGAAPSFPAAGSTFTITANYSPSPPPTHRPTATLEATASPTAAPTATVKPTVKPTTKPTTAPTPTPTPVPPILTGGGKSATPTRFTALSFTITGNESIDCSTITAADFTLTAATYVGSSQVDDMTCTVALTSTIGAGSYGTSTVALSGSFAVSNLVGTSANTASGFPMSWVVDRQAPVVGATSRSTNSVQDRTNCGAPTSITLTASVTDNNSGVQYAYVRLYRDNVLMGTYQMSRVLRTTTWTRTFTYAQLGSPGGSNYRYEFMASDYAGNASAWYSNAGSWVFTAGVCIT